LNIAQWLISLELTQGKSGSPSDKSGSPSDKSGSPSDKFNIHAMNEFAFKFACYNGYLEVAKWLLSLEPTHGQIILNFNEVINRCTDKNIVQFLHTTKDARTTT
jgi:hypothetical protein